MKNVVNDIELFPLKLGQCQETGLIQLIDPLPCENLIPQYNWITYFEPEGHLDSVVNKISKLLIQKKDVLIEGVDIFENLQTIKFNINYFWKYFFKQNYVLFAIGI